MRRAPSTETPLAEALQDLESGAGRVPTLRIANGMPLTLEPNEVRRDVRARRPQLTRALRQSRALNGLRGLRLCLPSTSARCSRRSSGARREGARPRELRARQGERTGMGVLPVRLPNHRAGLRLSVSTAPVRNGQGRPRLPPGSSGWWSSFAYRSSAGWTSSRTTSSTVDSSSQSPGSEECDGSTRRRPT